MNPIYVVKRSGEREPVDFVKIERCAIWAAEGLSVDYTEIVNKEKLSEIVYDGIPTHLIQDVIANQATTKITQNWDWTLFASRFLLQKLRKQTNNGSINYPHLVDYLKKVKEESNREVDDFLSSENFDLDALNAAIEPDRDLDFSYLALSTLYDRYLLKDKNDNIIELPQHYLMRVAMGLAKAEPYDRTEWAIDFYKVMAAREYMPSTPTLFNSGMKYNQLSSCFGAEMGDDFPDIMRTAAELNENSKFAGGNSLSLTKLRAKGSYIRSTGGRASGPVPYAKLVEQGMRCFDQGGKRPGVCAVYLETWHKDIVSFLEMPKAARDERLSSKDLFIATWNSDEFMRRVYNDESWTLFCPNDTPDLTEAWGADFEKRYRAYEKDPNISKVVVKAQDVWNKILELLFNHKGLGWPCFKDNANRRSMTRGYGVVHNSNLCTEILLRNSKEVSFVCNLGSVNLAACKTYEKIKRAVKLGVRMIDNAVSVGYLPQAKNRKFNQEDRPLGLGVMGYAQWLINQEVDYESQEHLDAADRLFEFISYHAIETSADLAVEKGAFPNFEKSQWAKGELPIDTAFENVYSDLISDKRKAESNISSLMGGKGLDWDALRAKSTRGMRNSHLLAIAPTATISNICDATSCTENPYDVTYERSNASGTYIMVSASLRDAQKIGRPELAKTSKGVDQMWTIKAACVRQQWIDQAQSTNVFVTVNDGAFFTQLYMTGWYYGLPTFYYMHSESASAKSSSEPVAESSDIIPEEESAVCTLGEACTSCQ